MHTRFAIGGNPPEVRAAERDPSRPAPYGTGDEGVMWPAAGRMPGNAAPDRTLTVLSVMVVPVAPILVGAQVWVWRTSSGGALPTFF